MILSVRGDESADETAQHAFAISAVFGAAADWNSAEKSWTEITKGEEFHASDWERAKRHDEYKALSQCLVKSDLGGISVALDLCAFYSIFGEQVRDVAYYKCFSDIISVMGKRTEVLNIENPADPITLEYIFDHRKQSEGNAGAIYNFIANLPEWDDAAMFQEKVSFQGRTNPQLQIADLVAHEAMKELDRKITGVPPQRRKPCQALLDTKRFQFGERDRAYCESWRNQMETVMKENGMSADGFKQWLEKNRRVQNGIYPDNMGTRLEYFIWLESKSGLRPIFKKHDDGLA